MSQRLNKYLAFHLGLSRREADDAIRHGFVLVDGTVANLGNRVEDGQLVSVNGKPVVEKQAHTTIALHKPVGYVCSRKQQGENPTIYSLLPLKLHHLKPVGRLDKDSSGLILLTDDGDFAYHMTHPQFYKVKVYHLTLNAPLAPLHQQMISEYGIQLEDGPSKFSLESVDEGKTQWVATMHEGRNRQIRRTFSSLGYTVTILHRVSFGSYQLGELPVGKYALMAQS